MSLYHSSKPDHWTVPRPYQDASLRMRMYGPIQGMDYGRSGFAVGLLAYGLSLLRSLRRAASLTRRMRR